jgi:DNA-binding Xre family transcriptional regulator
MKEKGFTIRDLQEKVSYEIEGKKGKKVVNLSTATIIAARDSHKIENCRLFTLKIIAHALSCRVKDLFSEDDDELTT